jgi:hypothetical protein
MSTTVQAPVRHEIETGFDGQQTRYTYFEASEAVLKPLIEDLMENYWSKVVMGPSVQGAPFELQFEQKPRVSYSNGYFTIYPGKWHFHLCVGPTTTAKSEELNRKRPVARAAIYESRGNFRMWGLRFWNGFGEQMTSISLPGIDYSHELMKRLDPPDYSQLQLYYEMRRRLLGEPIPADFEAAANAPWPETDATQHA